MSWVEDAKREEQIRKARAMRHQRPIAKELNFYRINEELYEIMEACSDIQWMDEADIQRAFDGDEDAEWEFKLAFSDLYQDCGKMRNDLNRMEVWDEYAEDDPGAMPDGDDEPGDNVPTIFDLFFPAIDDGEDLWGFDTMENDYFGLDWYEGEAAKRYARKKVSRLTKEQLLDAAGQCMRIARQYLAIKYRYECIRSSLDILRGEQAMVLKIVQAINDSYDEAERVSDGFRHSYSSAVYNYDQQLRELPERFWIE